MQESGNNNQYDNRTLLVIRAGNGTLSFSVGNPRAERQIVFEPYEVKRGISMAANLRDAFVSSELLMSGYKRVLVMTDSPVMLVPTGEFDENRAKVMYDHTFTGRAGDEVMHRELPELNAMAVFGVNKDFKLVVDDHFDERTYMPIAQPVWQHLHRRNFTGIRSKLYAYFHDGKMEVFCYAQNRFKFCNTFDAVHAHDALYYLLYSWKLLNYSVDDDELHLCGDIPHKEWFMENIGRHVKRVYVINPSADFNRAPIAAMDNVPYDLMALHLR